MKENIPLKIFCLAMNMAEHNQTVDARMTYRERFNEKEQKLIKSVSLEISSSLTEEGDKYDYELIYDTAHDDIEFSYSSDIDVFDSSSTQIFNVTEVLTLMKGMINERYGDKLK